MNELKHGMNCPALKSGHPYIDDPDCKCGLRWRIELQTAIEMHNAWEKRAYEAEADNQALRTQITDLELALKSFGEHHIAQMEDAQDRIDELESGRDFAVSELVKRNAENAELRDHIIELETFIKKVADQAICYHKGCLCPHCANAREAQGLINWKKEV